MNGLGGLNKAANGVAMRMSDGRSGSFNAPARIHGHRLAGDC